MKKLYLATVLMAAQSWALADSSVQVGVFQNQKMHNNRKQERL
ncbi:hypothetical protein [Kingella negevensis]|nr:hypothetical protein [Kingella negevensis]MDK4688898.1 hypothetical protein [Kingella negevensis]